MCNCNGIQYCVYCIRKRYSWIRENITLYLRGYPKNSDKENTKNSNTNQDETDNDSEFKPESSLHDTVSHIPTPTDDEKEKASIIEEIFEIDEENTENSNTYQEETDDDSEFKPEFSPNDTVSHISTPADDEKEKASIIEEIFEIDKENTENSNANQDETDDDSEFKPEYSLNDTVCPIRNPADDEKEKKKQQYLAYEKEKEKKQKQNLAISPDYIWEFFPFFIFRKNVKRIIVIFVKKCKKCKQILEYDFIEL